VTWTPGHRRVPPGLRAQGFHRRVIASAYFGTLQAAIYGPDEKEVEETPHVETNSWGSEKGPTILLSVRHVNKTGLLIDLGQLTAAELEVFEKIVNLAIEKARPVAAARDAIAREAEENGDYSFARSNRSDPRLVVKPRQE